MSPYFGGAVTPLIPKKRNSCCLDPRFRKDGGRGGCQRSGLLSTVTLGLGPRVQGKESLFLRGVKGRKSGISFHGCSHSQA